MDERDVRVAGSLAFRFATGHVGCEADDLKQVALLALDKASGDFDAARGVPFSAFAAQRMRRAIIDELRRMGPMGNHGSPRVQAADIEDFAGFLDRHDAEAAEVEVADDDVAASLSERERRILFALGEGETGPEVALREGVSESRVSQIRNGVRRRMEEAPTPPPPQPELGAWSSQPEPNDGTELSRRELLVLQASANDLTTGQTAELFGVGKQTVMTYRKRILRKLGTRSMTGAVAVALRQRRIR